VPRSYGYNRPFDGRDVVTDFGFVLARSLAQLIFHPLWPRVLVTVRFFTTCTLYSISFCGVPFSAFIPAPVSARFARSRLGLSLLKLSCRRRSSFPFARDFALWASFTLISSFCLSSFSIFEGFVLRLRPRSALVRRCLLPISWRFLNKVPARFLSSASFPIAWIVPVELSELAFPLITPNHSLVGSWRTRAIQNLFECRGVPSIPEPFQIAVSPLLSQRCTLIASWVFLQGVRAS